MRTLLLLSLSCLCIQSEGQAAMRELGELGFSTTKRIVHRMNKPVSATLSTFQNFEQQLRSNAMLTSPVKTNIQSYLPIKILLNRHCARHQLPQQQIRRFSTISPSLDDEINMFLNNCNTEIYSVNSSLAYLSGQVCETIKGLHDIPEIGYLSDLDSLLGSWSWKLDELKKTENAAVLKKLETPIKKLAFILERFEQEKNISSGLYSHNITTEY